MGIWHDLRPLEACCLQQSRQTRAIVENNVLWILEGWPPTLHDPPPNAAHVGGGENEPTTVFETIRQVPHKWDWVVNVLDHMGSDNRAKSLAAGNGLGPPTYT